MEKFLFTIIFVLVGLFLRGIFNDPYGWAFFIVLFLAIIAGILIDLYRLLDKRLNNKNE